MESKFSSQIYKTTITFFPMTKAETYIENTWKTVGLAVNSDDIIL